VIRADTQIMLVSDQAAPNLLAALDPVLKPLEAVLIVSAKMRKRADALERVLNEAGVKTEQIKLEDEHDFGKIEQALLDVASAREAQSIALNLTGGTKLMALAAQSVAQAANWSFFYVDLDTDEVIWLNQPVRRHALNQQLRLTHYLGGYGFTVEKNQATPQNMQRDQDLFGRLILQAGREGDALGQINWLAQQAQDKQSLHIALSIAQQDSRSLAHMLEAFADAKVLTVDGPSLSFASAADRDYAKGGWLESYVSWRVGKVSKALGLRDQAANLVVIDAEGTKNELDLAFMARNRLFVIECKTARMDQPRAPKANDTLYKLSGVCQRVGGLGTRAMLVSYRPLADAEKKLARALRIEVVCAGELAQLENQLRTWVQTP